MGAEELRAESTLFLVKHFRDVREWHEGRLSREELGQLIPDDIREEILGYLERTADKRNWSRDVR